MMFLWLFVIGGIIWYLTVKGSPSRNNNGYRSSQAKEILDQRFAKGEIDESTYQKMKNQLEEEKNEKMGNYCIDYCFGFRSLRFSFC